MFSASHGNRKICAGCRAASAWRAASGVTYGERWCDLCGSRFVAAAHNARYCCKRCQLAARKPRDLVLYHNPRHRGARRRWEPIVLTGTVRCARGAACKHAETVDGRLVGGLIRPGERWHLGHADEESVGGPEHVKCNTGAPSRLEARRRRGVA
jgi:hypothetical protein